MAEEAGGYSNPAMDPEPDAVAETSVPTDELCLRVDRLEVSFFYFFLRFRGRIEEFVSSERGRCTTLGLTSGLDIFASLLCPTPPYLMPLSEMALSMD